MALKKQAITFPFAKGRNDKGSDKVTPIGELVEAKNVSFDKAGQLIKRGAYVKQSNTIAFSNSDHDPVNSLNDSPYATSYNDEVLVASDYQLFSRSSSGLAEHYVNRGDLVANELTNRFLLRNENYKHSPVQTGCVYQGSSPAFTVCAYVRWEIPSGAADSDTYVVIGEVRDATTDQLLHAQVLGSWARDYASGWSQYKVPDPRVCVLGEKAFIIWAEPETAYATAATAATKLKYAGVSLGVPPSAEQSIVFSPVGSDLPGFTISNHRPIFDADVVPASSNATVNSESVDYAIIVGGLTHSNLNAQTFTASCDVQNLNLTVTVAADKIHDILVGDIVTGTHISGSATYVTTVNQNANTFTMNNGGTGTGTVSLTFSRGANETATNGKLKFEYFKNASSTNLTQFGTPVVTTSLTVGNNGLGSSGNCEALPEIGAPSDQAIAPGFAVKFIAGDEAADGQIFYAVSNYVSSGTQIRQKYGLIAHGLGSEYTGLYTTRGYLLRADVIGYSSTNMLVVAELADDAASGGSKTSRRAANHRIISFEMSRNSNTSGSMSNSHTVAYESSMASDVFTHGGHKYFAMSHTNGGNGSLSGNLLLMKAPPAGTTSRRWEPVGAIETGNNPINFTSDHQSMLDNKLRMFTKQSRVETYPGSVFKFGSNRFSTLIEYDAHATASGNASKWYKDESHSPSIVSVDFDPDRKHRSLTTANGMLLTGGFLHHYDGSNLHENNFFVFPAFTLSKSDTGGSLDNGAYLYRVVYEWYDDMGNIHRSAPSASQSCTVGGSNVGKTTLTIQALQVTRKRNGVSVATATSYIGGNGVNATVYRTDADGSVYYKIGGIELSDKEENRTVTFYDSGGTSPTEIVDNELLYAQGGLESNGFIGSCKDIANHKERTFVTTSENAVRYSKHLLGRDGVNFPDSYLIRVGSELVDVNAIESSREVFLLFTGKNGYYVGGDGPDNSGSGSFTQPRVFAPGVGAFAASDHAYTGSGTMIQTSRGIINILPNLQLDYISANVEDTLLTTSIHSICADEGSNEIRFFMRNIASSSSMKVLVYHTLYQQWTTHEIAYDSSAYGVSAFLATQTGGTGFDLFLVTADGNLHKYTPKVYQDTNKSSGAVNYDMIVETGYLTLAGFQGTQRAYRFMLLGDYVSSHTLTVNIFKDYDDSSSTAYTTSISSDTNPYHYRGHLTNQRCLAVKAKITISAASGEAVKLDGIAFEVGVRTTPFKLPETQTIGAS